MSFFPCRSSVASTAAHLPLLALVGVALLFAPLHAAQELPRQKEATRKDIDARIEKFRAAKKSPTLGLLKETINLSIAWGAAAYDDGDRDGCLRFYAATIERLLEAFGQDPQAAPEVRAALLDLQHAYDSSKTYEDLALKAWALRYGFDKVVLSWSRLSEHQQMLVGLGDKYFQLGLYTQSLDASTDAAAKLEHLAGAEIDELSLGPRAAPLNCARACFALRDWSAAADWLPNALIYLPDLPTYPINPARFYGDSADHAKALRELEADFADHPDDNRMRLVLATELFFLNRRERAKKLFQEILEHDKTNTIARAFLKAYPDSEYQQELAKVIQRLGAAQRADRMLAYTELQQAGRWAIPALHKAAAAETDRTIGAQVRELLQRLGEKADTPLPHDQEY